jgi:hypothetical protein
MTQAEFPTEGVILTHLYVVSDLDRSRHFYRDVSRYVCQTVRQPMRPSRLEEPTF